MPSPTEEDIAWFKSTFHLIPKPSLPDDCIEYSLYVLSSKFDATNDSEVRNRLREVQKSASVLTKNLLKDYIWQRESFGLEIVREDGLSLLRGRTEYGDSVEDEWVIVYLLRELSKEFEDLWIKVGDSDGEFLLIEAAGTLPAWLEPEIADNRVWVHQEGLVIIKAQAHAKGQKRKASEKLSLQDARKVILSEAERLLRSPSIEAEAFYRLRNYPIQIKDNFHHALVTVPRKIAYLLHQKPSYISSAVEAFYLRDPIASRPLRAKDSTNLIFKTDDLVSISVKFTRVGYAQLKSQEFPTPSTWVGSLPKKDDSKAYSRAETGMKLSCGFEMLLSDPQNQDKPTVREMKLVLEDLISGDEEMPTDEAIETWDKREDDENWLNISFEDLEGELGGKRKGEPTKAGDFGDKAAQENLQRIVSQFEKFLNDDTAGVEGADLIDETDSDDDLDEEDSDEDLSSEGEDKEASFDEEQFARMMREMMGMPPAAEGPDPVSRGVGPIANASRVEEIESESDEEEEDDEIQKLMQRMESELNEHGALDLDPTPRKMAAMEQTNKGKGKGKGKVKVAESPSKVIRGISNESSNDLSNSEDDVDVNLAKNLLESFKSQSGMAGPGGSLMGMMGMRLPRDEGDGGVGNSGTRSR